MGVLEDILKALDRVEIWKEVQNTPQRVSALEKRIGALEEKLGGKWPAEFVVTVESVALASTTRFRVPTSRLYDRRLEMREVWEDRRSCPQAEYPLAFCPFLNVSFSDGMMPACGSANIPDCFFSAVRYALARLSHRCSSTGLR